MHAVAEELLFGEFLDKDDVGGDEDGGLAGSVGNGNFDEGLLKVTLAAFEAQAAAGHVFALHDVVFVEAGAVDARGVVDLDAGMLAAIGLRCNVLLRRRQGENGDAGLAAGPRERLSDKIGGGRASGVNRCLRGS